jgi:23S rRNA (cytosine1962-C5)-methyltransferase
MQKNIIRQVPDFLLSLPPIWDEYELLDCGNGAKLERFGPYILNRPEAEAIWKPCLPEIQWQKANATFIPGKGEEVGTWRFNSKEPERWQMNFQGLRFWAQISSSRHIGIFPEQASQWEWINQTIRKSSRPLKILNLFGYSGIATLAAASAGAQVTHVDASQKAIYWARENQTLSGLQNSPTRWIVDDALKFVRRESRRGNLYDGIILDPPKFGRGPKGEIWEFYKLLPLLLESCSQVLSKDPQFIILTAYAVKASALTLYEAVEETMKNHSGNTSIGELVLQEKSGGRFLSRAIFAVWSKNSFIHTKEQ